MWRATVLTIFPDMFPGPLALSLAGKALARGLWALDTVDIRDHATGRHRTVDDTPAGGGPGMVMKADVLARAIDSAGAGQPRLLMSPRGAPLTQARIADLAAGPGACIVCGRFEGVDERVIAARGLEEVSVGDFVLSGGEIAALALIDACVRLLPGVMGKEASGSEESFANGLLEYPQYTRPQVFEGLPIPKILTSGDHSRIAAWRRAQAERLTRERRPDLWADYSRPQVSRCDCGAIGPHQGKELRLMKAGKKPLSMFLHRTDEQAQFPEEAFDDLVAQKTLVKHVSIERQSGQDVRLRRVFYALPDEAWRINAILNVNEAYRSRGQGFRLDLDRVIGLLLGYDQADIEAFVAKVAGLPPTPKVG